MIKITNSTDLAQDALNGMTDWISNPNISFAIPFLDEFFKMLFLFAQPLLAILMVVIYIVIWAVFIGVVINLGNIIIETLIKIKKMKQHIEKALAVFTN